MKKLKSVLAFTTALCICAGYLPAPAPTQTTSKMLIAKAEDEVTASGRYGANLTWTLDSAGTLTISGEGAMNDVTITAPWYASLDKITSVVLESGVTSVGRYAFYNCSELKSIEIPSSVETIGECAFYNCKNLTSITIPICVYLREKM